MKETAHNSPLSLVSGSFFTASLLLLIASPADFRLVGFLAAGRTDSGETPGLPVAAGGISESRDSGSEVLTCFISGAAIALRHSGEAASF